MPDQPIDKVLFRRRDIIGLHEYPSANVEDAILVRGHHPRHWSGTAFRWFFGIILALAILAGGLVAALETGAADGLIRDRAQLALAQAVGPDSRAGTSSALGSWGASQPAKIALAKNRMTRMSPVSPCQLVRKLRSFSRRSRAADSRISASPT